MLDTSPCGGYSLFNPATNGDIMAEFIEKSYPIVPGFQWVPARPCVAECLTADPEGAEPPVLWHWGQYSARHPEIVLGWHSKRTGNGVAYESLRHAITDLCMRGVIHGPIDFDNPFVPKPSVERVISEIRSAYDDASCQIDGHNDSHDWEAICSELMDGVFSILRNYER